MPPVLSEAVLAEIEATRAELIGWLGDLVRCASVTGQEGPAQALVADTLRAMDATVDSWDLDPRALGDHPGFRPTSDGYAGRPNVVGRWPGTGGGRSLILNAHVDVVPIEDSARWS